MNRTTLAALAAAVALSSCSGAGQKTVPDPQIVYKTQTVDTGCSWAKLITMTPAEAAALPDGLAKQILAHDREWTKRCAAAKDAVKAVE